MTGGVRSPYPMENNCIAEASVSAKASLSHCSHLGPNAIFAAVALASCVIILVDVVRASPISMMIYNVEAFVTAEGGTASYVKPPSSDEATSGCLPHVGWAGMSSARGP